MERIINVAGSLRTATNSAQLQTSTHTSQPSEIAKLLILLAESRQATVSASTLQLYGRKLSTFKYRDLVTAIDRLLTVERREGETAFPALGYIIAAVKVAAADRQERQAQQARDRDIQQLRANPSRFVSLPECESAVNELLKRRKAGEDIPIERRQWSTADTERYLRNLRTQYQQVA